MRLIDRSKLEMDIKKWLDQPCAPDDSIMVAVDDIAVSVLMTIEEQPLVNAIPIPEGATNGDVIEIMFPDKSTFNGGEGAYFMKDWWNTPYKKESEE